MTNIPIYGLTGNMGCGKSTVARFLDKFDDIVVFDADKIAKKILCEEQHAKALQKILGPFFFKDNQIALGKMIKIFDDKELLKKLERFIHPLVWEFITKEVETYTGGISFFVVESALIYEAGWQGFFKAVVVVTCNKEEQYYRLREYRKMTNKEIEKRLRRQLPEKEKVSYANFAIDTKCSLTEVVNRTCRLYHRLKERI